LWIDGFGAGWFGFVVVGSRLYRGRSDVSYASIARHTVHAAKATPAGKGIVSFAKGRIFFDTAVGIVVEWYVWCLVILHNGSR